MTDPGIDRERFRELADAYGGSVDRWPALTRASARRVAGEGWARAILDEAAKADAVLDAWTLDPIDSALAARIVAEARLPRPAMTRRVRLWWSGLAVGATLAGAFAGSVAAAALSPVAPVINAADTAFGEIVLEDPS